MEEFDLKSMWEEGKDKAHDYYKTVEDKVIDLAQEQSQGILQRFKRRSELELILGTLLFLVLLFFLRNSTPLGIGLTIIVLLSMLLISSWIHFNILKQIKSVNTNNVIHAIEQYIQLLTSYQKKTIWLGFGLSPILFACGFTAGFGIANKNISYLLFTETLLYFGGTMLIFLPLFLFIIKKYTKYIYGKYTNELQDILDSLKDKHQE